MSARVREAGIPFALSTHEFKSPDAFLKNLRLVIERGLPEEAAVRALTSTPAEMFDLDNQLGDIASGRIANMTLFNKPLSDEKAKVRYTFVDLNSCVLCAKGMPASRTRADTARKS